MSTEINEDGLSTIELQELVKFCSIYPEEFFGVQPCDIFLKNAKQKKFSSRSRHIINLSSSNNSGSHWICVMLKGKKAYYFDSYGQKCYDKNILKVFEEMDMELYYNDVKIQHDQSIHCGYFSVARLLCDEVGICHEKFIKLFNQKRLDLNDYIAVFIIKEFVDRRYRQ